MGRPCGRPSGWMGEELRNLVCGKDYLRTEGLFSLLLMAFMPTG